MTPLGNHLAHLETSGLIRLAQMEPELEYIFRHALVQDAAYESMLFSDRRQLHHQAGKALEQLYSGRLDELAPTLAHHFALAEDNTQALKYYTRAGDVAARSHASAEAIDHYTRALEITRQDANIANSDELIQLYTQLGRAWELNSDHDHALGIYAEMESLAEDLNDQRLKLAALLARATVHAAPTGQYDVTLADELTQQALPIAHQLHNHDAEARIYWTRMLAHMYTENIDYALEQGQQALTIARQHNLTEREAYALTDMMRIHFLQGRFKEALQITQSAKTLWSQLDNKPMLADSFTSIAMIFCMTGDYTQALAHAHQAEELSQTINNLWNQSYSQYVQGPIHLEHGQISQTINAMKTCIDLGDRAGFAVPRIEIGGYLSYVYGVMLGDLEQGFEWANQALVQAETNAERFINQAYSMLIYLHVVQNDIAQATALYQKRNALSKPVTTLSYGTFFTLLIDIILAFKQQAWDRGLAAADHMLTMLQTRGIRPFRPDALYYKAQILLALDRIDEAHASLTQARREAEALNSRRSLWFILAALSELEHQRGNPAEAANLHQQACETIDYIAEHIHQPDLRTSFLNQPGVRAVTEVAN